MKVKQTVTTKFHSCYTSWQTLEFSDENGDEIQILMTDDNYLDLAQTINSKAESILKKRRKAVEEAAKAKLAEENDE